MEIEQRIKQTRFVNAMAIIFGILGIVWLIFNDIFLEYFLLSPEISLLISTTCIMMMASIFLLNYLKSGQLFGEKRNINDVLMREELSFLRKELMDREKFNNQNQRLYEEVEILKKSVLKRGRDSELLSDQEKYEIISNLKKDILKNASESFLHEIEEKYSKEIRKDKYISDLREQCKQVRDRLTQEIESLGRRGNLNLVIGVLTTIAAVTILTTTVLSGNYILNANELIAYYAPRLTLSIFIEIFSFFFLRLYKAGLNEIKYFQNELTNAEIKFIAAEKAVMSNNESSISEVISELVTTERNFKLAKGESTVDLEKYRSDQTSNQKIMESLAGLIANKK
jgi:hypothetical protein